MDETGLTRKAVIQILTGITKAAFDQFKYNPEEFIIKAAGLLTMRRMLLWIMGLKN